MPHHHKTVPSAWMGFEGKQAGCNNQAHARLLLRDVCEVKKENSRSILQHSESEENNPIPEGAAKALSPAGGAFGQWAGAQRPAAACFPQKKPEVPEAHLFSDA